MTGFACGTMAKNPPANAGGAREASSIPGVGNSNPLQYSCLGNPRTEKPRGHRELDTAEQLGTHTPFSQLFVTS